MVDLATLPARRSGTPTLRRSVPVRRRHQEFHPGGIPWPILPRRTSSTRHRHGPVRPMPMEILGNRDQSAGILCISK